VITKSRHIRLAIVTSDYTWTAHLGFQRANIVLATYLDSTADSHVHPSQIYRRIVIRRYNEFVPLDMPSITHKLNKLESTRYHDHRTWSRQTNIIESPPDRDSALSLEEVRDIIVQYL
jgi:hypothetical protein